MSIVKDIPTLSAREILGHLRSAKLTVTELAAGLLEHIAARENEVQAWCHLQAPQVLEEAAVLDRVAPQARGPLHGVPFGVKDNIDTCDMPTAYGTPIHEGFRPNRDAAWRIGTPNAQIPPGAQYLEPRDEGRESTRVLGGRCGVGGG